MLTNLDTVFYQNADTVHNNQLTKKKGLKISEKTEWLLISINPGHGHWSLAIVPLKQNKTEKEVQVYHLDSLGGSHSGGHATKQVRNAVKTTLKLVDKSRSDNKTLHHKKTLSIQNIQCSVQKNGNVDCALFVCKYMEAFIRRISDVRRNNKISILDLMKGTASDVHVDNLLQFRQEMSIWLLKTSVLVNSEHTA